MKRIFLRFLKTNLLVVVSPASYSEVLVVNCFVVLVFCVYNDVHGLVVCDLYFCGILLLFLCECRNRK